MRVDLRTTGAEAADTGKTDRTRPASVAGAQGNTVDQAHFSFDNTRVRALESEVMAQPEVRQQRVDLLRQSLGKGEYAISDGQIADAMLADYAQPRNNAASTNRLPAAGARLPLRSPVSKTKLQQNRLPTRLTTWLDMNPAPCQPGELMEMRLGLLHDLVQSLEVSQFALARNDAEVIARGAAHQAELCRQWSLVEDQLHRASESRPAKPTESAADPSPNASPVVHLEKEFAALAARISHLTRVHCSLLRHLNRSLAIVAHVVDSCSPTYTPELTQRPETRPQAGD